MKILNRKKLITLHQTVCFLCGAKINAHTRCLVEWYGYGDHISDARHVCKTCEIMRIQADMFGLDSDEYQKEVSKLCDKYGVPKGPFAERQKILVDTVDMASMTLDEAIAHCNDIASRIGGDCGKNHKMLAFWLTEYRRLLQ